MALYTESVQEKQTLEPSARLLEHPYYQIMSEYCREMNIEIEENIEVTRKGILVKLNFYDNDKNDYKISFRIYEVGMIYFSVRCSLGAVTPETCQITVNLLNALNSVTRILYRAGMDEKNFVAISFRGEAWVLNNETFKGFLLAILDSAVGLRNALVRRGVRFVLHEQKESYMSRSNESSKLSGELKAPVIHPCEHPFVDGVYRWFEDGELDAARFEKKGKNDISWQVITRSRFRIWHCLFGDNNGDIFFKSLVVLGGIPSTDREKMKRKLLLFQRDWPCLYRLSLDNQNMVTMEVCAYTEAVSKGSYISLLSGLIIWSKRATEELKKDGFSIDRQAKIMDEEEEGKAG